MIVIEYSADLVKAKQWKDRLERISVPHTMIKSEYSVPTLSEGKNEIRGSYEIDRFLDEYEQFASTWNQDRCDMWFFDEE